MEYIEVDFKLNELDPWRDLLAAELGDIGFESFVETEGGLTGYVASNLFDEDQLKSIDSFSNEQLKIQYSVKTIEDQNWNEEWEKNFDPIIVQNKCVVRATFHQMEQSFDYDIVIDPKMSFGTGHHSTTFLILERLMTFDTKDLRVLDMGCGTGVLAILAKLKGSADTVAIDIDEWAYTNTIENVERNGVSSIDVKMGDVDLIDGQTFDLIIANINKNIILNHLPEYAKALTKDGVLLTSGFYESDLVDVRKVAEANNLKFINHSVNNDWTLGEFVRL